MQSLEMGKKEKMAEFGNVTQTPIILDTKIGQPNKSNNNDVNKTSKPSFTGLSSTLQRTVYASPELLQKMIGVSMREHKNALVGNLPSEIISIIRKNTKSPVEIVRQI